MRILPIQYYKLRSAHPKLKIINLSDDYGTDYRTAYHPYVETHISKKLCEEFPELVKQYVTNGEELLKILKEESKWRERLLLKWEYLTGLKERISNRDREFWNEMLIKYIQEKDNK